MSNEITTQTQQTKPTDTVTLSAIEIPSNINFFVNADIKKIIYDNLTLENVKGNLNVVESKLILKNIEANVLDGKINLSGSYDSKDPKMPWTDLDFTVLKLFFIFIGSLQKVFW